MKNVQPNDPILRKGCRMKEDRGSWINWYVYRPNYPVEAIEEEFHNYGSSEGGHIYSKKPVVRVSSTKILVKQHWFRDCQVEDFYIFWKSKGKPQNIEIAWDTHINIRRKAK